MPAFAYSDSTVFIRALRRFKYPAPWRRRQARPCQFTGIETGDKPHQTKIRGTLRGSRRTGSEPQAGQPRITVIRGVYPATPRWAYGDSQY